MLQAQPIPLPPAPPALPALPPLPEAGQPRIVVGGVQIPVPMSAADLRARRSELSNQLQSATSRRNSLARELRRAVPNSADRAGLEARIQGLDQRIIQLEADLAQTGQLLAAQSSSAAEPRRPPRRGGDGRDVALIGMLLGFFLLLPFVIGAARRLFGRPVARGASFAVDEESRERLARLETAVDTIAIEVERVAEGQRFVTKLLAEATAAPAVVAAGDAVRREALRVGGRPGEG